MIDREVLEEKIQLSEYSDLLEECNTTTESKSTKEQTQDSILNGQTQLTLQVASDPQKSTWQFFVLSSLFALGSLVLYLFCFFAQYRHDNGSHFEETSQDYFLAQHAYVSAVDRFFQGRESISNLHSIEFENLVSELNSFFSEKFHNPPHFKDDNFVLRNDSLTYQE